MLDGVPMAVIEIAPDMVRLPLIRIFADLHGRCALPHHSWQKARCRANEWYEVSAHVLLHMREKQLRGGLGWLTPGKVPSFAAGISGFPTRKNSSFLPSHILMSFAFIKSSLYGIIDGHCSIRHRS